jgi:hypothetical protein
MIAIADTGTALAIAMGYPYKGTVCYIQGFLFLFFGRVSWYFTDVLMFQLFCLVIYKRYFVSIKVVHLIIWPIVLIEQFLPYSIGVTYGTHYPPEKKPFQRCFLTSFDNTLNKKVIDSSRSLVEEFYVSFLFILLLTIGILGYSYYVSKTDPLNLSKISHIRDSISTAILYPIAMVTFYLPSFVWFTYLSFNHHAYHKLVIFNYLTSLQPLYGVSLSIIFYTKTKLARREWYLLYQQIFHMTSELEVPLNLSMSERSSESITNDKS